MTRFDVEPPAARERATALGIVAEQPMIFIVIILLASVCLLSAACALLTCQAVRYELQKSVEAVQISAYLRPQLTRPDAEGLRGRIEEMPMIARATLRTREEALAALASSGFGQSLANANPLPDVWIVQLRDTGQDGNQSTSGRIEAVSRSLSSLEAVESVKFDRRWVTALDDWSVIVNKLFAAAIWTICGTCAIVILGVHLLGGRSYTTSIAGGSNASMPVNRQALATAGFFAGLASLSTVAFTAYLATEMFPSAGSLVQLILASAGRTGVVFTVAAATAVLVVGCIATSLGSQNR